MISVTRAEANLLTVARVAVGLMPASDALRLFLTSVQPPAALGPTAREAMAQTLSRGTVLSLVRQGGWLSQGKQRLWERTAAPEMAFSSNTIRLLAWVLQTPLAEADARSLTFEGPLTVAEDALTASLLDRLRGTGCEFSLARQASLRALPLTTLVHVGLMAGEAPLDAVPGLDAQALGVWLEGSRLLLARSWLAAEQAKSRITSPAVLTQVGRGQTAVVDAFLKACDTAERHDLATFLIDAAASWLSVPRVAEEWTRSVSSEATLRQRTEARRSAGAMLRSLATLRRWDETHRAVRFIDEGYALAQRLVADWERLGPRGFERAAELVAEVDALATSSSGRTHDAAPGA
jgi:FtsH ternary system domain X6